MLGILAVIAAVQAPQGPRDTAAPHVPAPVAVRASQPPVIDGRPDDPVWQESPAITAFGEWSPTENAPARFRTEARIAYDAANLYVFVRAFDPHPDSLIRRLARRDDFPQSDRLIVLLDAYHDRRTGYEFGVTAAGGRYDAAVYDDGNEDPAWDAVWDVATRIDSLGWTAEFRIPLSQVRYGGGRRHTFGFAINRDIYRYTERVSWPPLHPSVAGLVSQLTDVAGFDDLEAPRRLEAAPYVVTKNVTTTTDGGFGREQDLSVGADLKYRVATNLTLDGTVNPDFGQVEADPAVLNLNAYETFFEERRPFFVAGRGVFRFDVNCNQVNCNSEGLFYSRRIGRDRANIAGAAKLTGRLAGGMRIGLLDAVTSHPGTNYGVLRLQQDYRSGEGSVGAMLTTVNRDLDSASAAGLHRSAYVGALDFRNRFLHRTYELAGSLDFSRVAGSAQAIAATQSNAVHTFQRPDAGLAYDTTRTVLTGDAEELTFGKVAGQHVQFQTALQRRSPGFEINDLGYLQRAGQQNWNTWAGYFDRHRRRFYQSFQWNANWWQIWTTGGLPTERAANTNVNVTLRNNWGLHGGATWGQLGATYCDACARGGPSVRQDPYISPWLSVGGDDRRRLVPYLYLNWFRGGAGHKKSVGISPELDLKAGTGATGSVSLDWSRNDNGYQWYRNFTDSLGGRHYTFARLEQGTIGITARFNITFSPTITLQGYAQPFITKGTYTDLRELSATPRSRRYEDRYQPYGDTALTRDPGGFNVKQLHTSVVFRWEYRPGSTLFVVWTQGREGSVDQEGTANFRGDVRDLFGLRPDNTFLVKFSYWLNY
jgi:hypothetical protein